MNAIKFYRLERWLYLHHLIPFAKVIRGVIFFLYNSFIPYTCEIGEGTTFAYKGMGVVLHSRAKIGKNCVIAQQVTVGGRSRQKNVPVIGDNVYMGAGAVVIKSVESGCAVAGVPAKVIRRNITMNDLV